MAFNAYTTAYYLRPSVLCTLYILFFHRGNWQYILIIHHNTCVTSRFAVNTVFEIIIIYIKAAEQGFKSAQYSLYRMYLRGKGVAKDTKKAAKWIEMYRKRDNNSLIY